MTQALPEVPELLQQMASQIQVLPRVQQQPPLMVGIQTGGLWLARRLHAMLQLPQALGSLDISFYRDDYSRIGLNPSVQPSHLPWPVDGEHILLVDDILYTGRTIRAAMNELFDYGRPSAITLAIGVDRGGRELPIQADVLGVPMQLQANEQIKLVDADSPRFQWVHT